MAIYTYLDLSTLHVTPHDMALLASSRNQSIHALSYPEGCVITAFWGGDSGVEQERADLLDELRNDGYSTLFCDMIQHAWSVDVGLIRLDCDADTIPELLQSEEWS